MNPKKCFIFLRDHALLDAGVLTYGLNRKWVDSEMLSEYIGDTLEKGSESVALEIAIHDYDTELARSLFSRVAAAKQLATGDPAQASRRWMFAALGVLLDDDASDDQKAECLEELHAIFGFPEELSMCSQYFVAEDSNDPVQAHVSPLDDARELLNRLGTEFAPGSAKTWRG